MNRLRNRRNDVEREAGEITERVVSILERCLPDGIIM